MAVVILMAAAAARQRREDMKKEILKYIPKDMKVPAALSAYSSNLSYELEDLGTKLDRLSNEDDKRSLVIKTIEKILADEKYTAEGDWGRDKSLSRLPRTIYGGKGRLELLTEKDASALFSLFQNEGVGLSKAVDQAQIPNSLEKTKEYIQHINNLFRTNMGFSYGIRNGMRDLVGEISLTPAVRQSPNYLLLQANKDKWSPEEYNRMLKVLSNHLGSRIYELGFWIRDKYANQGYITDSAKTLTKAAFEDLYAEFVIINTKKTNDAAATVAQKLQFVLEPHQFNNEEDMLTYSKSDRSRAGNFLLGKKLISKKVNP